MIKFFRHIRQSLIMKGQTTKYLKYAIGEILLVVVGILIALQINAWNDGRKLQKLEKEYLKGILKDLKSDASLINDLVRPDFFRHRKNHLFLDSLVDYGIPMEERHLQMVWSPQRLTRSGKSFYPFVGNYEAMISEGKSGLIRDRDLFSSIQELYDVWYPRNVNYTLRRDRIIDEVRSRHTYRFQYDNKLDNLSNKELLADLRFIYEYKRTYFSFLEEGLESRLLNTIQQIEKHLAND